MIKARLKRVRAGQVLRNNLYRDVNYSESVCTDWISIPSLHELLEIEDAIDSINRRRIHNSQKDDYFCLEVEFIQAKDLDSLKALIDDIDKGSRQHTTFFNKTPAKPSSDWRSKYE